MNTAANNGLPIGLEIDGPRHHDSRLLDIARRVERVIGTTA